MRLLHTSDWHLGRIFHGKSLLEDQHVVLTRLLELLKTTEAEALLVAGDVYDRAIPPVEAIHLLDWFLSETVLHLGIPIVMIAGNHDSAERLSFGSRLLTEKGLFLVGSLGSAARPLVLEDQHGRVSIYGLPYSDPPLVRDHFSDDGITGHESALRASIAWLLTEAPPEARSVLLAHAFVAGGLESESERPLSVAGAGTVSAEVFEPFAYTALGHLHRPQAVTPSVRYSGSLLRYSFSEISHDKSASLVTLGAPGERPTIDAVPLEANRKLRQIRGALVDLLTQAPRDDRPDDYLLVTLEDEGPVLDPMGKLRPYYPNVLHVERLALRNATHDSAAARRGREALSERELFEAFYREVVGEPLSDAQGLALVDIIERWHREARTETATERSPEVTL